MNWLDPQPIDDRIIDEAKIPELHLLCMTEADVAVVESELRIQVPGFLRSWFVENPFRDSPNELTCLVCHRDLLIRKNVELRREGYYGRKWPDHLLYIGSDGEAGAYFVDTTEDKAAVYWYDWEEGTGDTVLPMSSKRHRAEEFVNYINRLLD